MAYDRATSVEGAVDQHWEVIAQALQDSPSREKNLALWSLQNARQTED